MKLEGVPSSILSNLPSPFTAPCGPCHLLNSIDYVRNQTTLPAITQGDAQSEDYIFPTRYKEKQRYPVPLNESLVLLCIYNTNTKPLGAFLSPSEVAHLPCGVGSEHGFAASTLYLDLLSLLLIIEEHPLRAATLNDYYSLSLFTAAATGGVCMAFSTLIMSK